MISREQREPNGQPPGDPQKLHDLLVDRGAALVAFADLSAVDEVARRGFPRAVSVAAALDPGIIADIRTGPTVEYGAEYGRVNGFLNELTAAAAEWLIDRGHAAEALPATSHSVGPPDFRAPFQHKTAATLAGHGWIGKCALLITESHGSAVRLSTVLTDAPLPVREPVTESHCGDCEACKTICPGRAVSGEHWRRGMAREEFWSPAACQAGMRAVSEGRLKDAQICGMCIAACPWTLRYLKRENAL